MDLSKTGVVPVRTENPLRARELLERDGAAILTGCGVDAAASQAIPHLVFGSSALAVPPAAKVSEGGERDRKPMGLSSQTRSNCHSDGYAYGWQYPDYFLLLCDVASEQGGESFLVDGYALLDELAAAVEMAWLANAVRTVPIDQTESGMRPLVGPLVSTPPGGRQMLVMANAMDQKPTADSEDPERDRMMIETWRSTVYEATDHIQHFKLEAGEAVIVDNYRLFHGREPYEDENRRMWRVWSWTDSAAFGVPDGVLHSDSRNARLPV